jgi:hypothetical protein
MLNGVGSDHTLKGLRNSNLVTMAVVGRRVTAGHTIWTAGLPPGSTSSLLPSLYAPPLIPGTHVQPQNHKSCK